MAAKTNPRLVKLAFLMLFGEFRDENVVSEADLWV